jgi:hypothetical protein
MASKEQLKEFSLLDERLIDSIPDLQTPGGPGEKMLAAARLFHGLEASQKKIISQLHNCTNYSEPSRPQIQYNPADDSQALLRGEPIENLIAPAEESQRLSLLRQLRATEIAAPQARIRISEQETKIIQSECGKLRPALAPIIGDTLNAVENLVVCLRAERQLFGLLSRRGFTSDKRPNWLNFWPQELSWLNGGERWPSMEFYLAERRKFCEIEPEVGKKGA